jgi:hypothetical protein
VFAAMACCRARSILNSRRPSRCSPVRSPCSAATRYTALAAQRCAHFSVSGVGAVAVPQAMRFGSLAGGLVARTARRRGRVSDRGARRAAADPTKLRPSLRLEPHEQPRSESDVTF